MTALPTFLQPAAHSQTSDLGGGPSDAQLSEARAVESFEMICQEDEQWCWAAVTQAVERWHNTTVSQTDVASYHAGTDAKVPPPNDCEDRLCGLGPSNTHRLSKVLSERKLLGKVTQSAPRFEDIKRVIGEQRPLPVRIKWNGDGGHFLCISGYSEDSKGRQRVKVHDPLVPGVRQGSVDVQTIPFQKFVEKYGEQRGQNGTPDLFYEVVQR